MWSCSTQVSCASVFLTWHSVFWGLQVRVHYVCTPRGEFQCTLSECQVWLLLVIPRVNVLCVSTMGVQLGDGPQGDAYFDNRQDSFCPGCHLTLYASWATLPHIQKYLISMDCKRCLLTVLFAIPTAVALSKCTIVLGCGCLGKRWQQTSYSWSIRLI